MPEGKTFFQKVWSKIDPIISHCLCVLFLGLALLFIAGLLWLLENLLPDKKEFISYLKTADIWLIFAILCLFGLYTFILIAIILFKHLRDVWNE